MVKISKHIFSTFRLADLQVFVFEMVLIINSPAKVCKIFMVQCHNIHLAGDSVETYRLCLYLIHFGIFWFEASCVKFTPFQNHSLHLPLTFGVGFVQILMSNATPRKFQWCFYFFSLDDHITHNSGSLTYLFLVLLVYVFNLLLPNGLLYSLCFIASLCFYLYFYCMICFPCKALSNLFKCK